MEAPTSDKFGLKFIFLVDDSTKYSPMSLCLQQGKTPCSKSLRIHTGTKIGKDVVTMFEVHMSSVSFIWSILPDLLVISPDLATISKSSITHVCWPIILQITMYIN